MKSIMELSAGFRAAVPVWIDGEKGLNETCAFYASFKKGENVCLKITASNFYSVYINGELLSFGPARAAHGYFRVDELPVKADKEDNSVFIIVAGYRADSYWALNQDAFLQAELTVDGELALYTGRDFTVRRYDERVRKVCRFSFQRTFTESYRFGYNPQRDYCEGFSGETPLPVSGGKLLGRKTRYPRYERLDSTVIETGFFKKTGDKEYDNLCFYKPENSIYAIDEWETNPAQYVYNLQYRKNECEKCGCLGENTYAVYDFGRSETGFIQTGFKALTDAHIYVIFDEIDLKADAAGETEVLFYRNNCINIIEYDVKAGEYCHCGYEPYSARYVKVIVRSGSLSNITVNMIRYANPDSDKFFLECANEKLMKIIEAGKNTFAHNAVDLLSDCPSRERAGWLCDSFFSARVEQLLTGNNDVEYDFLQNYALAPEMRYIPREIVPMCYPADFASENQSYIPNWAMWYIVEMYDNYLRTADDYIANLGKKRVYGIISFFERYKNEYGLLENLDGWIFVEWSKANDEEFVCGVNFPSNMLYAKALYCAGKLYNDDALLKQSDETLNNIRRLSFNGEFFEDNRVRENGKLVLKGHITETCQYYAFFTGAASVERYPALFDNLLKNFGAKRDVSRIYPEVYKSNAFIGNYLRLMMLCDNGQKRRIETECIDFFYNMAVKTGTLWENDNPSASLDHGFASYACNLIVDYLCGYKGRRGNTVIFSGAGTSIDCKIRIPQPVGEVVFIRKGGKESITVPDGCVLQRSGE